MQINLTFDNLGELHEFVCDYALRELAVTNINTDTRLVPDTRPVTAEGAIILKDGEDVSEAEYTAAMEAIRGDEGPQEAASAATGEPISTAPVVEAAPKRKRRTKAEIEAERLAAEAPVLNAGAIIDKGDGTAVFADGKGGEISGASPLDNLKAEPAAGEVSPEIVALAGTLDGADKLAHMNEGREFIAKHGFPKYNETFALADVPANIAAHTPEQAALHRAAMQWLAAQAGAK